MLFMLLKGLFFMAHKTSLCRHTLFCTASTYTWSTYMSSSNTSLGLQKHYKLEVMHFHIAHMPESGS